MKYFLLFLNIESICFLLLGWDWIYILYIYYTHIPQYKPSLISAHYSPITIITPNKQPTKKKKKKKRKEKKMSVASEFEAANEKYAASFTKGGLPLPPAR